MIARYSSTLKSAFAVAAATFTFAVSASAATLTIPPSASAFGRVGGITVAFNSGISTTAAANWTNPGPPVNGQSYEVNSLTVTKNNAAAVGQVASAWVGVYSSYSNGTTAAGTFGDFLGVSDMQAWNTVGEGALVTWTFSGIQIPAAPGASLVFAFQTSAASMTGMAPITLGDNQLAIRRMTDANTLDAQGAAIIEASGPVSGTSGQVRTNRVPGIEVQVTLVPEPSTVLLGAFGVLGLLRRRRA